APSPRVIQATNLHGAAGSLAVSPSGSELYVVLRELLPSEEQPQIFGDSYLTALRGDELTPLWRVRLTQGGTFVPRSQASDIAGALAVNTGGSLAVHPQGGFLYLTQGILNRVWVIDIGREQIVREIDVGLDPTVIVVAPGSK